MAEVNLNPNVGGSINASIQEALRRRQAAPVPGAPEPVMPTPTPRTQQEIDMLRQRQQAQAAAAAQQRDQQTGWSGRGIIGSPVAALLNSVGRDERLEKYTEQELQRLQAEDELRGLQSAREYQDEAGMTMFEETLGRQTAAEERKASQQFEREQDTVQRRQEIADREAEWAREERMLAEKLARDDQLREEERQQVLADFNNERTWAQIAETDEFTRALLTRYNEMREGLPALARMAGIEGNEETTPSGTKNTAWSWLKQATGGTGPIAQYIPFNFRDDTQTMERLVESEALNTLSNLETPLTPVSDADLDVVRNTSLSMGRDETNNYDFAVKEIETMERVLRQVADAYLQQREGAPPGVARPSSGGHQAGPAPGVRSIRVRE